MDWIAAYHGAMREALAARAPGQGGPVDSVGAVSPAPEGRLNVVILRRLALDFGVPPRPSRTPCFRCAGRRPTRCDAVTPRHCRPGAQRWRGPRRLRRLPGRVTSRPPLPRAPRWRVPSSTTSARAAAFPSSSPTARSCSCTSAAAPRRTSPSSATSRPRARTPSTGTRRESRWRASRLTVARVLAAFPQVRARRAPRLPARRRRQVHPRPAQRQSDRQRRGAVAHRAGRDGVGAAMPSAPSSAAGDRARRRSRGRALAVEEAWANPKVTVYLPPGYDGTGGKDYR